MKRIFVAMVAAAFIAGLTPASAQHVHGGGVHAGGVRGLRGLNAEPPPSIPDMQSRIPAPLPAPAQAPVINGPLSPNPMLPPMGNGL